jgi:ABC-type sugar transport system permease subunit
MAFTDYRWLLPQTHGLEGFNGVANWVEMFKDLTFWNSLGIAFKYTLMILPSATVESMALFAGTSGGPGESALTVGV